jgi:DNA-binding SARP family transcriptional activator/tetratricopeptide (TPR) repeat protein
VLDISLLGEQRIAVDGAVVAALRSPRAMSLLAYLVLHRDAPQPREYLAGLFWPGSAGSQARTNLRRELHHLRASAPQVARSLTAGGATLCWRPGEDCRADVAEFETAAGAAEAARSRGDGAGFRRAAAEAAGVYRGDLMPACYDDWVTPERDRLHRRCLTLLDWLVEADTESGAYGEAIGWARRRIALEPLEEVGYRSLLRLHALAGDRAAALRTYHRCVSVLEQHFGVAPDRATTAEYERLVRQETSLSDSTPSEVTTAGPVRLVGRARELGTLRRCWREAAGGRARLAVVTGDAGIGKSRLLGELMSAVRQGGGIAVPARCFAARDRLALAPVSEWLRSPELRAARSRLEPVWARETARLVPPPGSGHSGAPRPVPDAWQRHRFFEGLARAVLAADRPVLLVLDDMQWCDEDTVAWLQLLLRLGQGHALCVAAALRPEEGGGNAELATMLRALRSARQVTEVELSPLGPVASAELAAEVLGGRPPAGLPDMADWLYSATGGYPLFIVESARARMLGPPGSPDPGRLARVRAVLAGRIGEASPAAREVARLASVIGHDFTLELLTEASDLDGESVVGAVDELWRRRIIREHSPASYDFTHDLLRDAAYARIGTPRRRLLHRRVAQALELLSPDDLGVAASLAGHYEQAGQPARAVPHHVRAAESATRVFANQQAVRCYQRAAGLLGQLPAGRDRDVAELAIRHAMAAPLTAQQGYAATELQAVLQRARDLAEQLGDTRLELLSLVGLFTVRYVQGHIAESYQIGLRSLELSKLHPDVTGQAHFAVAGSATSLGLHEQALRQFALAHELCQDAPPAVVGTRLEVHARAWSAHALWLLGRDSEALRWCDWAIARAEAVDHPYTLAVALAYAAITHQLRGDVPRTLHFARRVREICDRYDFAYYGEWGLLLTGWCTGGSEGAAQIRAALRRLRQQGALARQPYYLALLAQTLLGTGQQRAAEGALRAARAAAAANADRWWLPEVWRLTARHRAEPARGALLRRAVAVAEQQGCQALLVRARRDLAAGGPSTRGDGGQATGGDSTRAAQRDAGAPSRRERAG